MGFLRLITNSRVMGVDVLTQVEAWKAYRRICLDARIRILAEPFGIEAAWHALSSMRQSAANLWTDAYLQAFGQLVDARVVSFDRGFRRFGEPQALILGV